MIPTALARRSLIEQTTTHGVFEIRYAVRIQRINATYGGTDEYGLHAVDGKMHTTDLHATLLALLGLDHESLTYRYAGRDFRLTDVAGSVVKEIFA